MMAPYPHPFGMPLAITVENVMPVSQNEQLLWLSAPLIGNLAFLIFWNLGIILEAGPCPIVGLILCVLYSVKHPLQTMICNVFNNSIFHSKTNTT